jgi:hypothetical protein
MITLDEARERIGSGVVYSPGHRYRSTYDSHRYFDIVGEPPASRKEDGTITSVNDTYVFVRYAGDTGSKATSPNDLEFLS